MTISKSFDSVYQECHINIAIIPFLEKQLGRTAWLFEEDFSIDKKMLLKAAAQGKPNEKVFFWICRNSGTYCAAEQEVFILDTTANQNCQDCHVQPYEKAKAFIIEVSCMAGREVMGNVYKLDLNAYASEVSQFSKPMLRAQSSLPQTRSITCHAIPADPVYLNTVLYFQKCRREKLAKAG